ncbi:30S ribosomal protein S16 [Enterobacteriaceae endosymbiont of Donacia cincticornis]|uniref:30S ribosomal protein S16 n=1 Tax=Enterobacteriaceae endosymbiont of Donacia cincticornis TaxID=2675773 RepID=UPI0014497407|nr:30S ribosomal protein S16 [Enterobacteriaceae endosymbiont of Donacia cincticornis]QJC36265.1 30S ribosomal protein S16 [Enterobacteriaceae endosymbiont of Donacia cincticornis]
MVKIRLSRKGIRKKPFYQIIVTNSKNSRDGRFIEKLGYFDPLNSNKKLQLNKKRIDFWISKGAILSKRIYSLIK